MGLLIAVSTAARERGVAAHPHAQRRAAPRDRGDGEKEKRGCAPEKIGDEMFHADGKCRFRASIRSVLRAVTIIGRCRPFLTLNVKSFTLNVGRLAPRSGLSVPGCASRFAPRLRRAKRLTFHA